MKDKLFEKPISLPGNPFWNIFKRFGRDELIALVVNVLATAIIAIFFKLPIIISLAGPIIEKIGFFPAHFKEAFDIYKTTPKDERKKIFYYFKKAIKRGTKSLTEDVLIHDPLYILFIYFGLILYPLVPAWILSLISFIIAVFIVSGIELTATEIGFWNLRRKMLKIGFEKEKYIESRFLIDSKQNPKELIKKISEKFKLTQMPTITYNDIYLENEFPEYSGRIAKVRLRKRLSEETKTWMKTVQIIYTKAQEKTKEKYEQYRFFPIKKEKIYFILEGKMPKNIIEIDNRKIVSFLKKYNVNEYTKKIEFKRTFSKNDILLVSVDKTIGNKNFYVVEIKTRDNPKELIEAMRYIMKEFPVIQTTKNKYEIH